ncbi:DUF1918 domain-containing protein [Nocardia sp. CWNU-33]|uniref:DUF1918 domain-containing protein n=1 Tax=Nocardia sp. CWNU-33 TaxID=3392117 RepID=UPI00398EA39B
MSRSAEEDWIMHPEPGNWLIVEGSQIDDTPRCGLIEEVPSAHGSPPYLVHWTGKGHRALISPGRTPM